jgi:hypothetical protein
MRAWTAVLLTVALAGAARAQSDAAVLLSPADVAGGTWSPLLTALAAKGGVQASFTERRYFPFRSRATVLQGTIRISPARGLSLQYTGDDPNTLIADTQGLLVREPDGRSRELPAGSREGGAVASLLPIMRFDLPALFPKFEIRAQRTPDLWRFEFTPKDPEAAAALGLITVVGSGTDVRHLQFRHAANQRVDIDVENTRSGVGFTPAELRQFFR